jgi:transposase
VPLLSLQDMVHNPRELLRVAKGRKEQPGAAIFDSHTLKPGPESGERAGYDGAKRRKGSKTHLAVDTLGYLLALYVTSANEQDREQVAELAQQVREATDDHVEIAFADQGYTGVRTIDATCSAGIDLIVVRLPEAKLGFVLLPCRWAVERSFGWMARFRRLSRDYERLAQPLTGLRFSASAILMLQKFVQTMAHTL